MGDENIFLLFPKELWGMILDRVEDSKDVLQVFKAYPELDTGFENKKRVWLVGQVVRILMNRFDLEERDLLNCRLICKQWKMRVDCALETQPVLQAYQLERDKEEKDCWKAFEHWNMLEILEEVKKDERIPPYFSKKFFGGIIFNSDFTNLAEFLEDMKSCPPNLNPFVGRILTIIFSNNVHCNRPEDKPENNETTFWSNCFQVLERFGRDIWHLNFFIDEFKFQRGNFQVNTSLGIWNTILQVLAHVPNSKSVQFAIHNSCERNDLLNSNPVLDPLPPSLPNLESLSIPGFDLPNELINPILSFFGRQLRKLEMPVEHWREGMGDLFTNLTELEVKWMGVEGVSTIPNFSPNELVSSINAPNLVNLQISYLREDIWTDLDSEIFKWLRRFPALKYLNIGDLRIDLKLQELNCCKTEPDFEKFPSLQYLSIRDSGKLSFNFLRSFPSLRELKMVIRPEPLVTDLSIPDTQIKLREELQTLKIYDSNIWEHLPKLMSVILYETVLKLGEEDEYFQETYKFNREGYEKARREKQRDKDDANRNEFSELREYIQWYLGNEDFEDESDPESMDQSIASGDDRDSDLSDSSTNGSLDDNED